MNELFPIIRRKRRPLLAADAPAKVAGSVEPVRVVATGTNRTDETDVTDGVAQEEREANAKISTSGNAR
ncbi:MAG TPA: hypothetical protein PKA41_08390 [Verrucomicrobiota bacterium]|nr:hypothetical protein [Verrucomicrobiota bacterium]